MTENTEMSNEYDPKKEYIQIKKLTYLEPIRNKEYVPKMESDIKKYLTKQFNEARLRRIKKTTNWNHTISEEIKKILNPKGTDVVSNYR